MWRAVALRWRSWPIAGRVGRSLAATPVPGQKLGQSLVYNRPIAFPERPVGKLSRGVGGIDARVISRPWEK
jgi:hypothetical protein